LAASLSPRDVKLLEQRLPAILEDIPPRTDQAVARLTLALIAAEDHRFLLHMGVELRSVLRAASGVLTGRYSGGSTIEQQLIRVVRGRYELTIWRKLTEILLALSIYERFEKIDLARMYAEIAYYGWRGSGLKSIAQRLGYNLDSITQDQAIELMSLLRRPLPRCPSDEYTAKLRMRIEYVQRRCKLVKAQEAARELVERARL
jgi:membrane peptidoglycan carboxypeptidase